MANQNRSANLQKLREKLMKRKGSFKRDPSEWRISQVGPQEEFKAKAYILPPLERGETCSDGEAKHGMDGLFFFQVGDHWINRKRYPCPRVYDNDECAYCQLGFRLLRETQNKKSRSEVSRAYLPSTKYVVNLYFPDTKTNPEEVRGKVLYYAMPKTIFDKLEECIQLDNPGNDPDDPQAWGIFYDPQDAYPLSVVVNKKGDYNSYVDSKLLAAGRGKIASNQSKIDDVLGKRHDISTKYPERSTENLKTLQGFVDDLMNGKDDSDDGFNVDETQDSVKQTKQESVVVESQESSSTSGAEHEDDELNALLNSLKSSD